MAPSNDDPDGPCLTVLPQTRIIGLSFTVFAGSLSMTMVLTLLGLVTRNFIRNVRDPPRGEWRLIRTHIDAYLLSLLGSEILQGIGATMNAKWILEGALYCSGYCSVQGALKTIGETGVAMSTMAVAIHTFMVVFFHWIPGPRSAWIYRTVIGLIWVYTVLFVIVASVTHPVIQPTEPHALFSPVPYWCWISSGDAERIMGEYLWLWFALLSSMLFYTLLFLRLRGNIQVDPRNWKHIRFRLRPDSYFQHSAIGREAMSVVIWYPVCYSVLVLPLSVVRWITFHLPGWKATSDMSFILNVVAITLFGCSGAVSVVLILLTRRNLLLLGPNRGSETTDPIRRARSTSYHRE